MENPIFHPFMFLYQLLQLLLDNILSAPAEGATLDRPKIAIIGAGLTGVSAATHCVGHGFDVRIFEAGPREQLGGIWSRAKNTSDLHIHSLMYRFRPSVQWNGGYPNSQQIVSQITELWKRYKLEDKTKFNTKVERVYRYGKGRWIINNITEGYFEGVIVAVGACGENRVPLIPGQENFKGERYHSSDLTGKEAKEKTVIVIGDGASAVEALEFAAHEEASKIYILSRSDKWIIPRNVIADIVLALNIFDGETILAWIPEILLRKFFYRDIEDLASTHQRPFTDTPMINSGVMNKIRSGQAEWLHGDVKGFTEEGIRFNQRSKGVPKGGPGREYLIKGDIVVMATGYERPSLNFLTADNFRDPYQPPNWYLQAFPPSHPTICCNNCTYLNAIGTAGNWHTGIYTRILLMFLSDPLPSPRPYWMELWIDTTCTLKKLAPKGAFDFVAYLELVWWLAFYIVLNPSRWKWAFFVLFGVDIGLPRVVEAKDELGYWMGGMRNKNSYDIDNRF
ncbi:hypothetical protein BJ875DRAFT_366794 [Amylocarpus encephaloides]|uniref:FAD/NAD(P)-binding domain-containing protein n=1 Tax=Amylocarpus encephaloides TaxID=45428 RepID=A0A9P7YTX5_9HELO|nr:hypothetical protein BJ875DRAFT_366794 [Amylocarpus encephaloides]